MRIAHFLILCLLSSVTINAQKAFTIDEAIEYTIKNSNQIKLNRIDIEMAEKDIKEYYALGLPKINGKVDYQHFLEIPVSFVPAEFFGGPPGQFSELQFGLSNTLVGGLSMNTLIFDGSFLTGIRAQKLYREFTSKSIDQTSYEIRKNVTEAYVNVLLTEENIEVIDKNLENLNESITETRAYYDNGFVEKLDVDRLELSYDNLLAQKKSLERLATLGRNVLKFQMYYPMEEEVVLTQSLDDIVDQVLMVDDQVSDDIDYSKRPEYQTILLGQQLNDINLKATRNSRYPSLYGFANYQQQLQRNNLFDSDAPGLTPISIVGLTLNVPIYNGGEVAIKEQKIKLDMEKTSIQKNDFERAVDLQIMNAYQQYLNAKENMFSAKRQEALAEDIYDITTIKYKEGVGSSLETRQAERELYTAQQQYMQALFELVSSKVALDVSTGDINENPY